MADNRRKSDHEIVPTRLVIHYVGAIGLGSLIIGGGLAAYFGAKQGNSLAAIVGIITMIIAIPNGCVMGMLGLLGQSPTSGAKPAGTPIDPVSIAADTPIPVTQEEPKD